MAAVPSPVLQHASAVMTAIRSRQPIIPRALPPSGLAAHPVRQQEQHTPSESSILAVVQKLCGLDLADPQQVADMLGNARGVTASRWAGQQAAVEGSSQQERARHEGQE
jgi:hypothetical protein